MPRKTLALFGGSKAWNPADWTDSDDRVRGGKSQVWVPHHHHRYNSRLIHKSQPSVGVE